MIQGIQTEPKPSCPDCGAKMIVRCPKPPADWPSFWGCMDYPDCKGTREIMSDGTPEPDDEFMLTDFS